MVVWIGHENGMVSSKASKIWSGCIAHMLQRDGDNVCGDGRKIPLRFGIRDEHFAVIVHVRILMLFLPAFGENSVYIYFFPPPHTIES